MSYSDERWESFITSSKYDDYFTSKVDEIGHFLTHAQFAFKALGLHWGKVNEL